jgi:hypothetical protein
MINVSIVCIRHDDFGKAAHDRSSVRETAVCVDFREGSASGSFGSLSRHRKEVQLILDKWLLLIYVDASRKTVELIGAETTGLILMRNRETIEMVGSVKFTYRRVKQDLKLFNCMQVEWWWLKWLK